MPVSVTGGAYGEGVSEEPIHRSPHPCQFCIDAGRPDGYLPWSWMSDEHRRIHSLDVSPEERENLRRSESMADSMKQRRMGR